MLTVKEACNERKTRELVTRERVCLRSKKELNFPGVELGLK